MEICVVFPEILGFSDILICDVPDLEENSAIVNNYTDAAID